MASDRAWPHSNHPAQFRKWLFDRLKSIPDVQWDESQAPTHSSYSEWHAWGVRRAATTPSASSDTPSSPSRSSSFNSRPATPRQNSTDSVYHQTTQVVARISRHSLNLERQWQMARSIAKIDPKGRQHMRALSIFRLPARDANEPTVAVILYENVGYNHLRDFANFGPNWYTFSLDAEWKDRRPSYKPNMSANSDYEGGNIHLPAFMDFAIGASAALALLQRANLIHGEIRGDSFHFCKNTRTVRLAHLGNGSRTIEGSLTSLGWNSFSREPGVSHRLQFVAPEQTGRTNTPIDARTDIYRLGIVLWNVLTGELPFPEDSPLSIIQNAFTRRVAPVTTRRLDVPDALSAVITKMVAKNSRDRYHSAAGLEWDLTRIQQLLSDGDSDGLVNFKVGCRDINSFFVLPNTVLGREEEKRVINNVIERQVSSKRIKARLGGRQLPSSSSNSSRSSISTTNIPSNGYAERSAAGSPAESHLGSGSLAHRVSVDIPGNGALSNDFATRSLSISTEGEPSLRHPSSKFKRKGHCELITVHGPGGVGKSSLVSSIMPTARAAGYCATARAAEGSNTPFEPCTKLLSNIVQQLFSEADISSEFHEALRNYMRPTWKKWSKLLGLPKWLLDSQIDISEPRSAASPGHSPKEPQSAICRKTANFYRSATTAGKNTRFTKSYIDLMRFISDRRFVLLCLEELQFADEESVALLEKMVTAQVSVVLVVTTREQPKLRPRERSLMNAKHGHVTSIALAPLTEEMISDYICDTLKRPPEYCFPLCAVVYSQTRGNMFLVKEMLDRSYKTGAIQYSMDNELWSFDLDAVFKAFTTKEYTSQIDDDYIRKRIQELSAGAVSFLKWASLFGQTFSFLTVKHLLEQDSRNSALASTSVDVSLIPNPKAPGKIDLIRSSSHDAVRALQEALGAYIIENGDNDDSFKWCHVRFRQATEKLCSKEHDEMQFTVANLLVTSGREADASVWAKARHTSLALDTIKKRVSHRRPFRDVLNEAGASAVESNLREKAMKLWSSCLMLLQPDPWDESQPDVDYQETLSLYSKCAESYFFLGHLEPAKGLLSTIMKQARDAVDKVPAFILNARLAHARGDGAAAFRILKECIHHLGLSFKDPTWEEFDRSTLDFLQKLKDMDHDELLNKPLSESRTVTMLGSVLCESTWVAYWANPLFFGQLAVKEIELYLKGKVSSQAGLGFIHLATVSISRYDMVDFGCELALIGLQLLHKFSSDQFTHGRGWTLFHSVAGHICIPLDRIVIELSAALDDCIRGGDPASAMLNISMSSMFRTCQTEDLSELEAFCTFSVEDLHPNWQDDIRSQIIVGVRQWSRTLQGKASHDLENGTFFGDEGHDVQKYTQFLGGIARFGRALFMYDTWRAATLAQFGHYEEALSICRSHYEQADFFWSAAMSVMLRYYFSLSELGVIFENGQIPEDEKTLMLERAAATRDTLQRYGSKGNVHYQTWGHLIAAQIFEILEKHDSAVREYEHAQDCAEVASIRFEFALCTEMAAEFLVRRGANRLARASLQEAVSAYRRIAAWAKADQVQQKYALLLEGCSSLRAIDAAVQTSPDDLLDTVPSVISTDDPVHGLPILTQIPTSQSIAPDQDLVAHGISAGLDVIDFQSILNSTQLLASELDFDKLTQQMSKIIMDSTGAWLYGLVQKDEANDWILAHISDAVGSDFSQEIGLPLRQFDHDFSKNVAINALRYKETVIIRNTLEQSRFIMSEAERAENPVGKAVIVMPITRGEEVTGAVYLEGASFTDRSISVLTLLVNAFGIAIANSNLFKQVERVSASNAVMVEAQRDALEKARKSEQKAKMAEAEAMRNVKLTEEAAKAKSMFLANVSHELRTPLNGVIGMSELLKGSKLTSEQEGYADSIRVCADTLLTVINDILDYSKLEAGKMQIFNCELSLYETINEVVRALSYSNVERKLETIVKLDLDRDALVMGDPVRLHQVLMNLMSNSYKFTNEGSITVSAHVLTETERDVKVSISVADTGVGITEEQRKKLFLPFSQADSSTARSYGGTGLGLSICKAIIEGVMGGKISLQSAYGKGTTVSFTITLQKATGTRHMFTTTARPKEHNSADPMAQYSRSETAKDQKDEGGELMFARQDLGSIPRANIRVLVAEDNPVNQKIAIAFVKKLGFVCEAHENGREAVDALHRGSREGKPFHIVLMDVQMPVLDGYDATREIRKSEDKAVREVLVIAMTASAIRGDREKCLQSGMDSYLAKPVRQQVLKQTLERYINAPQQAREELAETVREPSPMGNGAVKANAGVRGAQQEGEGRAEKENKKK